MIDPASFNTPNGVLDGPAAEAMRAALAPPAPTLKAVELTPGDMVVDQYDDVRTVTHTQDITDSTVLVVFDDGKVDRVHATETEYRTATDQQRAAAATQKLRMALVGALARVCDMTMSHRLPVSTYAALTLIVDTADEVKLWADAYDADVKHDDEIAVTRVSERHDRLMVFLSVQS